MAATALAAPRLSQIHAWDTAHLDAAATHWTRTAHSWEDAFTKVYRQAPFPGGTPWEGDAAEAAILRAGKDRLVVIGGVDRLHGAAQAARHGADEIQSARNIALRAVDEARMAGFTVGEDLSVTSSQGGPAAVQAARQAQAQMLAAAIRARAAALMAIDEQVAANVTMAIAGVNGLQFDSTPVQPDMKKTTDSNIQAVDNHTFRRGPAPNPGAPDDPVPGGNVPPVHTGKDVRDILGPLENGDNKPHRQLGSSADIRRLYEWLVRGSVGDSTRPGFPRRVLEDGTVIGIRESSESGGVTIEVKYPDGSKIQKVHLPTPIISGPPELPPLRHPPVTLPEPQTTDPPVTLPPMSGVDPAMLPPWLQNPSPPGFQVNPNQRPPIVPLDAPDPPPLAAPPAPPATTTLPPLIPPQTTDGLGLAAIAGAGAAILSGIGNFGSWLAHPLGAP